MDISLPFPLFRDTPTQGFGLCKDGGFAIGFAAFSKVKRVLSNKHTHLGVLGFVVGSPAKVVFLLASH